MWIKTYQTRDEAFEQFLDDLAEAERRAKLAKAYGRPADYTFEGFDHCAACAPTLEPHHD